jgi:chaperonin GroES
MKYTPNGKRLIITRKKHETKSKFGILMPESMTEKKLSEGYVTKIATGCQEKHWKEGMHVIFAQFGGQEIKVDENIYLVLAEEDVLVYGWDTEEGE